MSASAVFPADLRTRRARYDLWLKETGPAVAPPVLGLEPDATLSLDVAGLAERGWDDLPLHWTPENGKVLHGGYGEDRAIYDAPAFRGAGEPRTLHLGLDIFAHAGTEVFAPLDGCVHSLQRNDNEKDYGPTLILQHETGTGFDLFTLYGHLAADVLSSLAPGDAVGAGQKLGELGDSHVNGGWAPHLHFQVMLDLLGHRGDFPGVCRKSEADLWLTLCPDPRPLLGLPPRS